MTTKTVDGMKYEKTGTVKSKRKNIERTMFREYDTSTILVNVGREMWARYSTEILATALFGSWAIYIWAKLG